MLSLNESIFAWLITSPFTFDYFSYVFVIIITLKRSVNCCINFIFSNYNTNFLLYIFFNVCFM